LEAVGVVLLLAHRELEGLVVGLAEKMPLKTEQLEQSIKVLVVEIELLQDLVVVVVEQVPLEQTVMHLQMVALALLLQ
jgi:hypothetical protein